MKASVTLGGVPLAGSAAVAWQLTTGTSPYANTYEVHKNQWEQLKDRMGVPLQLVISDQRGDTVTVERVYILHQVASSSPNRVAFVVADQRWKWRYPLIARDYNMPRKTGERSPSPGIPVPIRPIQDEFRFLAYSLKDGRTAWSAQEAVEDVLAQIIEETGDGGPVAITTFPIENGSGTDGQFSLQNVQLRDTADAALGRLLSYIPGANVYINLQGRIEVVDTSNLDDAQAFFQGLAPSTWAGERAAFIDRKAIRPSKIRVYYQREVELLVTHRDDYGQGTSSAPVRNNPYVENVIPTVAEETQVAEYDPEANTTTSGKVAPGTWVPMVEFFADLQARGIPLWAANGPWDAVRLGWVTDDIDGLFRADTAGGSDELLLESSAVQSIKQHFRQTFRLNRRYMSRIRQLKAVRSSFLNPITGQRSPALAWAQACQVPSAKGQRVAARREGKSITIWRNVDYFTPLQSSEPAETTPSPVVVSMVDADIGVFRLDWAVSPYGLEQAYIPCQIVDDSGALKVPVRDLSKQDKEAMAAGTRVEGTAVNLNLRNVSQMATMLTMVPNSPNNKRQFHVEEVDPGEISALYRGTYNIEGGQGPVLEVFVPPSEVTARFQWTDTSQARSTIQQLLGLDTEDPNQAGIEGRDLPGFELVTDGTQDSVLRQHAIATAAEFMSPFADNVQGQVRTRGDSQNLKIQGNVSSVGIGVSAAPSARVESAFNFPGQPITVSRFATMPESARAIILGTLPFE